MIWLQTLTSSRKWDFILDAATMCVDQPGYLCDDRHEPVDMATTPRAGAYTLVAHDDDTSRPLSLAVGPLANLEDDLPAFPWSDDDHSDSSMSTSSHSSRSDYSSFCAAVFARDGQCLVTGAKSHFCVACPIIPFTRPEVWAHFGVEQPYGASCGITLSPDLHAMYQRYAFSFYPNGDGRYTLHFFEPQCDIYYPFHGKEISRDAFHTVNDCEIPFDEYFRWHYAQCVMLHLRGTTVDQ